MPLLHALDAEAAHRAALAALRLGLAGAEARPDPPVLAARLFGRALPNPVGLAAGFDKDAVAVAPLFRLGFGLVEAGTATPRPQPGNPRPRLFRLAEDRAVINRMGMNNQGVAAFAARLASLPRPLPGLLGANVGINKEGADPERDYPDLYEAVAPHADYVAINLSSPNTPGLRDLQGEARLAAILSAVAERRARLPQRPPLAVKIAPDLSPEALGPIVETCAAQGVAALIVANTTTARDPSLRAAAKGEAGGLSGRPLFAPSTDLLRRLYPLARGRLELIGCGGVEDGATAYAKLRAGASVVQLYTALAFAGPALVGRIKEELAALLARDSFATAADAVGADHR
jgi:dihydroorotate dehydrogenase